MCGKSSVEVPFRILSIPSTAENEKQMKKSACARVERNRRPKILSKLESTGNDVILSAIKINRIVFLSLRLVAVLSRLSLSERDTSLELVCAFSDGNKTALKSSRGHSMLDAAAKQHRSVAQFPFIGFSHAKV